MHFVEVMKYLFCWHPNIKSLSYQYNWGDELSVQCSETLGNQRIFVAPAYAKCDRWTDTWWRYLPAKLIQYLCQLFIPFPNGSKVTAETDNYMYNDWQKSSPSILLYQEHYKRTGIWVTKRNFIDLKSNILRCFTIINNKFLLKSH